jgi:hypothetical protein
MSTLQVANVWLESTANNRIQMGASNNYVFYAGGQSVMSVNSSSVVAGALVANATGVVLPPIYANGSIGTAGQALLSNSSGTFWGSPSYTGANVFTSNSTFTVPAGVTRVRAQVLGGAGGTGSAMSNYITTSFGAYITGTVGSVGATGTASGASGGAGGTGTSGDVNISGGAGTRTFGTQGSVGQGGQPAYFGGVYAGEVGSWSAAGCMCTGSSQGGGGAGGYAMKVITGLTPGSTIAVTVRGGICVVEW